MARPCLASRLILLAVLIHSSTAAPPFWPEDNCQNTVNGPDIAAMGLSTAAINPYSGSFETHLHPSGRVAGPLMNSTAPCKLTVSFSLPTLTSCSVVALGWRAYAQQLSV
jgi:hypothetical protein